MRLILDTNAYVGFKLGHESLVVSDPGGLYPGFTGCAWRVNVRVSRWHSVG